MFENYLFSYPTLIVLHSLDFQGNENGKGKNWGREKTSNEMQHIYVTINCLSCILLLIAIILIYLQVKEEAQQLALIFETDGAFKVKRKWGKERQIFGTWVESNTTFDFLCYSQFIVCMSCLNECILAV